MAVKPELLRNKKSNVYHGVFTLFVEATGESIISVKLCDKSKPLLELNNSYELLPYEKGKCSCKVCKRVKELDFKDPELNFKGFCVSFGRFA